MAFASIMLGSFVGFLSAITGFAVFDLHIWQTLLLYTSSGTLVAVVAIAIFVLRSSPAVKTEPQVKNQTTAAI